MFDIIIYVAIIIFAAGIINSIYSLAKKDLTKKRKALLAIFLIICIIIEAIIIYGSFIEPQRITITKETVQLSNSKKQTINVALISDTHLGPYKKEKFVKKICNKLIEQKPDVVLLAGDFIAAPGPKKKKDYTNHLYALKCMSNNFPTYAVIGNHEYNIGLPYNFDNYWDQSERIKNILKEINIKVLNNESILFEKENSKFWLVGVDEVWALKSNLKNALAETDDNYPKILLAHNPDIFHDIEKEDNISLVLNGHTHGGQIRLPFIGTLVTPPSDLGRECYEGFCQLENARLFISRGIGETAVRARLFGPPEIAILELHF